MISRHLGRALTEQQRRRWFTLLLDTADEVGLPNDPNSARRSSATSNGVPGWR